MTYLAHQFELITQHSVEDITKFSCQEVRFPTKREEEAIRKHGIEKVLLALSLGRELKIL